MSSNSSIKLTLKGRAPSPSPWIWTILTVCLQQTEHGRSDRCNNLESHKRQCGFRHALLDFHFWRKSTTISQRRSHTLGRAPGGEEQRPPANSHRSAWATQKPVAPGSFKASGELADCSPGQQLHYKTPQETTSQASWRSHSQVPNPQKLQG